MTNEEKQEIMNEIDVAKNAQVHMQTVSISNGIYGAKTLLSMVEWMIADGFSVRLDADGLHANRIFEFESERGIDCWPQNTKAGKAISKAAYEKTYADFIEWFKGVTDDVYKKTGVSRADSQANDAAGNQHAQDDTRGECEVRR